MAIFSIGEDGKYRPRYSKNEIILFENQRVKLEVNLSEETVWLNLEQMSELFDRDKSVISRHIKNALNEELKDEVIISKLLLMR